MHASILMNLTRCNFYFDVHACLFILLTFYDNKSHIIFYLDRNVFKNRWFLTAFTLVLTTVHGGSPRLKSGEDRYLIQGHT